MEGESFHGTIASAWILVPKKEQIRRDLNGLILAWKHVLGSSRRKDFWAFLKLFSIRVPGFFPDFVFPCVLPPAVSLPVSLVFLDND